MHVTTDNSIALINSTTACLFTRRTVYLIPLSCFIANFAEFSALREKER